jgi:hypothetical protein
MTTVLFCGSRSWIDPPADVAHLRGVVHREVIQWVEDVGVENILIIEGECRGPDQWAAEGALLAGVPNDQIIRMPLDWKHGKGAGYKRNLEMLDLEPDYVVAFYNGYSGGTHHTVTHARKRGIPVLRVDEEGEHYIDSST